MNSLDVAGGLLLVGTGFLVAFSPIPLILPWGSIYIGLLLLGAISIGLAGRNTRHANAIAVALVSVLIIVIAFAAVVSLSSQTVPLGIP